MKVLHILYSGLGGHGNVFFSMVSADTAKEYNYAALFNGVEPPREEYIERCVHDNIAWSYVRKKRGLHPGFYLQLYRNIRRASPDVILLHGGIAIIPCRLAKLFSGNIKKILVRETQANHLKNRGDWLRLSLAMMFADKMVYLSEEYRAQVQQKLKWLYKKNRTVVIPNGIDLHLFSPSSELKQSSLFVLGMQSRLVSIKDHSTLFAAFSLLKKQAPDLALQLQVAGDGECKNELVELAKQLKIEKNVVFCGTIGEKELVIFLQGLSIYVHASLGETMSTAIMQAMACGKPVVASDVNGINNMIQHNVNGLLVPPREAEKMAFALMELINNEDLRKRLARSALVFAQENFSNLTMFERYKKAITD